jgi:hypothetical protein
VRLSGISTWHHRVRARPLPCPQPLRPPWAVLASRVAPSMTRCATWTPSWSSLSATRSVHIHVFVLVLVCVCLCVTGTVVRGRQMLDRSPKVGWEDIAGLEHAKKSIREIVIWPMLRPYAPLPPPSSACALGRRGRARRAHEVAGGLTLASDYDCVHVFLWVGPLAISLRGCWGRPRACFCLALLARARRCWANALPPRPTPPSSPSLPHPSRRNGCVRRQPSPIVCG